MPDIPEKVKLINQHIIFTHDFAVNYLKNEDKVNLVYIDERHELLLAPVSFDFFRKLHKTAWSPLKIKNSNGDKSLSVRDILLDYDLYDNDRELTMTVKTTGIISISLQ